MKRRYSDFDYQLLKFIYECRAITLEQLAQHFKRTQNVIYKIVSKLSKQGLISTEGVSYIKNNSSNFQGKCAFLTSKGISILREFGTTVNRSAERNKPTKNQMPFVLLANEIKIHIDKEDWDYLDSRDAKVHFNRNYNELFNGVLRNKKSQFESVFYVLPALSNEKNAAPSEKYFYLLSSELIKHYEQMKVNYVSINNTNVLHYIHNYMFFCKSEEWFYFLLEKLFEIGKGSFISRVSSVKIFPFNCGLYFLSENATKTLLESFLTEKLELKKGFPNFKIDFKDSSLGNFGIEYEINFKGERFYVVDLMDFDLKKVHKLKYFTEHEFKKNGSIQVLIFTSTLWKEFIESKLTYGYFQITFIEPFY